MDTQSQNHLASIQHLQDLLSKKLDLCLVITDYKAIEITLPSNLPLVCSKNEQSNSCKKFHLDLIASYKRENCEDIIQCPKGLYLNIFQTSFSHSTNPIYLISGRTPNRQLLKSNLNLLHLIYTLPSETHPIITKTPAAKIQASTEKKLTNQELRIITLITSGLSNKEIAYKLGISENTVKSHAANILQKLDASSRTEAAYIAIKNSIIGLG